MNDRLFRILWASFCGVWLFSVLAPEASVYFRHGIGTLQRTADAAILLGGLASLAGVAVGPTYSWPVFILVFLLQVVVIWIAGHLFLRKVCERRAALIWCLPVAISVYLASTILLNRQIIRFLNEV